MHHERLLAGRANELICIRKATLVPVPRVQCFCLAVRALFHRFFLFCFFLILMGWPSENGRPFVYIDKININSRAFRTLPASFFYLCSFFLNHLLSRPINFCLLINTRYLTGVLAIDIWFSTKIFFFFFLKQSSGAKPLSKTDSALLFKKFFIQNLAPT